MLRQGAAATAAGAAMPASPQSAAAARPAAAAAAPATAAGHDGDARNCSRRIHHRLDLTAFDLTAVLSETAPRQIHHCSLSENRSSQQSTEDAAA